MRWLGGIAVDRRAAHGVVEQAAARLTESESMYLAIAPAGTRSQTAHWKSGFYHIANTAQVPIMCGFLDYGKKVGGVALCIVPTGDIAADMDAIRACYDGMTGARPGFSTSMMLKEEMADAAKAA
jgi:1-acyl-sn-glycerol-3-phosphate acyltransferase